MARECNTIHRMVSQHSLYRRRFLEFLAGSPLALAQSAGDGVIAGPDAAINVMDFEPAARKVLPPAHWGYLQTGVDDDATLKANREGYQRYYLRPRRLVDISKSDMSVTLFGVKWETPIGLCPIGNQMAFHPQAEVPVARAARKMRTLQILSTASNTAVEDVAKELGRPPWYQLYPTNRIAFTETLVKRVDAAGCPVLAWTVDTIAGRHTETFERLKLIDKRDCKTCHGDSPDEFYRRKPMFTGAARAGLKTQNPSLTWTHLERMRKWTSMKLLVKGIETGEDARLCVESGADGIIVSNHGARAEESGRGTIDCLPEVVEAVGGKVPVFLDGGIRRGTDIFKALALGAKAVFVGRPYIWGLAAFGQPGVERVIDILRVEFELVMKQCGVTSVEGISRKHIGRV
jgi:4-hydroxymandelate oxidase